MLDARGVPDLLVGYAGRNVLLEVKEPLGSKGGTSRNGQKLKPDQENWWVAWQGQAAVVRTVEDAIEVVFGIRHDEWDVA
jgi:hypothetical protein